MKDFTPFENSVSVIFKNKKLLEQAFIHRSFINENPRSGLQHNERLEFLGDAVLELVATEFLYARYPGESEGKLTSWRAALVNTKMISLAASKLDFGDFLLVL
jgi:ribonuclease-3